jgi:hypothetical protein
MRPLFAWTGKLVLANMRRESKTTTTNHPFRIVCHDQGSMRGHVRQLLRSIFACCLLLPIAIEATEFTVDSTSSSGDNLPGDGLRATVFITKQCTPPVALDETNALAGIDTSRSPASTCREGGFIDVDVIVNGAEGSTTVIDGSPAGRWRQDQYSDASTPGRVD